MTKFPMQHLSGSLVHLYGSLVISTPADTKEPIRINGLDHTQEQGEHHFLRFRRGWQTQTPLFGTATVNILSPARNKFQTLDVLQPYRDPVPTAQDLRARISDLDSNEDGSFLDKLHAASSSVHEEFAESFVAVLNNTGVRSYIALLSGGLPIYLVAVVEQDLTLQLMWSTDAQIAEILRIQLGAAIFVYRFATILNRPVVINTQYVCSFWHRVQRSWANNDTNPLNLLHGLNALEARLYKQVYPVGPRGPIDLHVSSKGGAGTSV